MPISSSSENMWFRWIALKKTGLGCVLSRILFICAIDHRIKNTRAHQMSHQPSSWGWRFRQRVLWYHMSEKKTISSELEWKKGSGGCCSLSVYLRLFSAHAASSECSQEQHCVRAPPSLRRLRRDVRINKSFDWPGWWLRTRRVLTAVLIILSCPEEGLWR